MRRSTLHRRSVGALVLFPLFVACGAATKDLPSDNQGQAFQVPPTSSSTSSPTGQQAVITPFRKAACPGTVTEVRPDVYRISRETYDAVKDLIKGHLQPTVDGNGQLVGIELVDIKDGSCLEALGLRDGDTLHSINGINLVSPSTVMQAYESVKENRSAIVTIKRGPDTINVEYTFAH